MRTETFGNATLILGDCREVLPDIGKVGLVLTDPPYGSGLSFDYADRFKAKACGWWKNSNRATQTRHEPVAGDAEPFDPSPVLAVESTAKILWGANWYANRLPDSGGWWIWDKRGGGRDVSSADWPMSEAELAWTDLGKGVRMFRHTWFGLIRDSERGDHFHPTQKPVALMRWCIVSAKRATGMILDPFMGSGPVGVAAAGLGRPYTGIEVDEKYFDIACRRVEAAVGQGNLFDQEAGE